MIELLNHAPDDQKAIGDAILADLKEKDILSSCRMAFLLLTGMLPEALHRVSASVMFDVRAGAYLKKDHGYPQESACLDILYKFYAISDGYIYRVLFSAHDLERSHKGHYIPLRRNSNVKRYK